MAASTLRPLLAVQRAVVQRDGQRVLVGAPQLVEAEFGLAARVDEDERGAVRADEA